MLTYATSILPEAADWTYYRGMGCQKCLHTGYRGRTTIFEYMEVSDPIKEMVLTGTGSVALRRKAIELGMAPLAVNGLRKVQNGITTVEEVMSVCSED
jgi:general secretion pathway protein E